MSAPSRRERIATAALQGLIASDDGPNQPWSSTPADTARTAIEIADALIAELGATEPPQPPPAREPDMLGPAGVYQTSPRPAGDLDRSSGATDDASPSHGEAPAVPEVKVTEDSDEGPVRISWNGKEWAQASALTEAESELNRAYDCLNHWKGEADKLRAELELVRGELSEAREIAARNARDCEHLRQSAIELTTERDAARASLARLRAKVGPVVEWWRSYTPVLVDLRGIVPVLARRLDVLKAGWADDPEPGGESNG